MSDNKIIDFHSAKSEVELKKWEVINKSTN